MIMKLMNPSLLRLIGSCLLGLFLFASQCYGQTCEKCSLHDPCEYTVNDGFNVAYSLTWCIEGQWYTGRFGHYTALDYIKIYEIKNPFREK